MWVWVSCDLALLIFCYDHDDFGTVRDPGLDLGSFGRNNVCVLCFCVFVFCIPLFEDRSFFVSAFERRIRNVGLLGINNIIMLNMY